MRCGYTGRTCGIQSPAFCLETMILFVRNSDDEPVMIGRRHSINFVIKTENDATRLSNGTPCCLAHIFIDQASGGIPLVVPGPEPIIQGWSVSHFLILTREEKQ